MALSQWKEAILEGIFMEIEEGVVMEKNLERLENLVEIIHREGSRVPESVKEAYRQVAVECTAKCLAYERNAKEAYIEAVKSIWLGRIMPLCDKVNCLVTRDLLNSCRRVWTAHTDEKVCESLMNENTREKALVSLMKVVSELHPNLANAYDDRNEDESIESDSSEESGETESMDEARETEVNRNSEEPEAMDEDQESFSETELKRHTSRESFQEGDDVVNPSATNTAPKKCSLMERRSTAHTYEWVDSIDNSDKEMSDDGERSNKSRRKRVVVSPLTRKKSSKSSRRPHLPWCTAETLAVMKGYEMYGADWKRIKEENPVLVRRTSGDVKDKYRVEMRRREHHP